MDKFIADAELDFHDFGSITPGEIDYYLADFINISIKTGCEQLLIITGKGNFIRPLVNKFLKQNRDVKKFKQAGYYSGGQGAFEVWI